MSIVWDYYPGVGNELLLALKLADHADDVGMNIYPTVDNLARTTRQSRRGVQRQLRRMEETGFLVVTEHAAGGRGHTRRYALNPQWLRNPAMKLVGAPDGAHRDVADMQAAGKGDILSPFTEPKGRLGEHERVPLLAPFGDDTYIRQPSLTVIPPLPPKGGDGPFELFWQAWPVSPHKQRKAECLREWRRAKLDREIDLVLAHLHRHVIGSPAAIRDGGQYLMAPKKFLVNAEWREPTLLPAAQAKDACHCGAVAEFRIGGQGFCKQHFREESTC